MKTNPDERAFAAIGGPTGEDGHDGLTKREYFAVATLQGLLANDYLVDTYRLEECAVEHADRLIRALNQSPVDEEANDDNH